MGNISKLKQGIGFSEIKKSLLCLVEIKSL